MKGTVSVFFRRSLRGSLEPEKLILMERVTATDAARRFSELLDAVEQRGESFVVVRHGKGVATIGPIDAGSGRAVKEALRTHSPDRRLKDDVLATRAVLSIEKRGWDD